MVALRIEQVGSGASQRPQRNELLRAARRREIDAILVGRLDCWGRSLVDLVTTLQELVAVKVGVAAASVRNPTLRNSWEEH